MELEDLDIEIDDAFINEDWFRAPVSDLDKEGVETLRMAIRTVKEEKYKRWWENDKVDEDWGPTSETYQAIEEAYDHDVGLDNYKLEKRMHETLRGRIDDLNRRELEVLRQEIVDQIDITWGDISRREFLVDIASLGTLSLIAGGVVYGGYKAYQSHKELVDNLVGHVRDAAISREGGEGPLTYLNREFDSAAEYAEFMAGIDYRELSTQEQRLAKGLSSVWSSEGLGGFSSLENMSESLKLDSEVEKLFEEMIDTVGSPSEMTPAYVLNQSEKFIYEYNAAKVMAIELGNDLYQERMGGSFQQVGDWLMDGLQEEVSPEELDDRSGVGTGDDIVNRYLHENYGGEPGLIMLKENFDDFNSVV